MSGGRERSAAGGFTLGRRSAQQGFTSLRRSAVNGFTSLKRSAVNGFTLIEMLVALLIFGLIAAAGVVLLGASVRAQAAVQYRLDDVAALTRTNAALGADLAQAVDRPTRDETGALVAPFMGAAGGTAGDLLAFVRGGWSNIDGAPRAGLQKLGYRLRGDVIERMAYPMLDGAASLPPAPLLSGVARVDLRYRLGGAWSDRWPVLGSAAPLPDAVELRITRLDGRDERLVLLVGAGFTPEPAGGPRAPQP